MYPKLQTTDGNPSSLPACSPHWALSLLTKITFPHPPLGLLHRNSLGESLEEFLLGTLLTVRGALCSKPLSAAEQSCSMYRKWQSLACVAVGWKQNKEQFRHSAGMSRVTLLVDSVVLRCVNINPRASALCFVA